MNYIIVYLEIEHLLNFLSQSEKGDFLDLLIQYGKKQELPVIENPKLLNVFNFMKGRLDTQFEKARIKAENARKNGANGGRPSKPKGNPAKPKKTQLDNNSIPPTLPEFISEDLFDGFIEMRKKIKKPMTEKAKELIIEKLSQFEKKQAGFANKALKNSIENSWQGVFEPTNNQQKSTNTGTYLDFLTGGQNGK